MYTVLGFETVFNKIFEENWKQFCVEISYSLKDIDFYLQISIGKHVYSHRAQIDLTLLSN